MKPRMHVTIPHHGPLLWASWGLMALSGVLRLGYYLPRAMEPGEALVHLILPMLAVACFLAGVGAGGRWAKPGALAALALGVLFFIAKAQSFTPVHKWLCTLLYLTVLVLFGSALLGLLPTKKLLYPLFGLPLLYHIFVEDLREYLELAPPLVDWLPEISVLCIMASLLCLSVALEAEA